MSLDPVLLQAGINPQILRDVEVDLAEQDVQLVPALGLDLPHLGDLDVGVRGVTGGRARRTFTGRAQLRSRRYSTQLLVLIGFADGQGAWRAHPVEWLVGPVIGMDAHRVVRLDDEQALGPWKVGGETAGVVNLTFSYDKTHGGTV